MSRQTIIKPYQGTYATLPGSDLFAGEILLTDKNTLSVAKSTTESEPLAIDLPRMLGAAEVADEDLMFIWDSSTNSGKSVPVADLKDTFNALSIPGTAGQTLRYSASNELESNSQVTNVNGIVNIIVSRSYSWGS